MFTNAVVISGQQGIVIGGNLLATEETSEPDHFPPVTTPSTNASIWYRWTAPSNDVVTFRTTGSGYDTVLAIYTGSDVGALALVENDDDTGGGLSSLVTFTAVAGTEYRIAVDGYDGGQGPATGMVVLSWRPGDGTIPLAGVAGSFQFSSFTYLTTENETFRAPFVNPVFGNTLNGRSVRGAIVTVTRTGGSTGRVSVDYATMDWDGSPCASVDTFDAVRGCDYTTTSGRLWFDEFETTKSFVVPVRSDFDATGDKRVGLVLTNLQVDPIEEFYNPGLIAPVYGANPTAVLTIREMNQGRRFGGTGTNAIIQATNIVIERATYALAEAEDTITVDILNVGGTAGNVLVHVVGVGDENIYVPTLGSDYADPSGASYGFPQFSGGTGNIPNPPDFLPIATMTVAFAQNQGRRSVVITNLNDAIVEFNEDIFIFLERPSATDPPLGPNFSARITILHDEDPAGALDREWNPDDVSYSTPRFNNSPGANNIVRTVAVQPDQRTVIGGDFTAFNSFPRSRIARINVDGSHDTSFNPGTGADDFVTSIAIYPALGGPNDGKIVAVGGFTSMNNIQRNGIARLNTDGSLDTTFSPGGGANGVVRSVALQGDGKVVLAGEFNRFNGVERNGVARLNVDGSLDTTFNPGSGAEGIIWSVAVIDAPVRKIFIGGDFLTVNGVYHGNVARLNENGSIDLGYDSGGGADGPVYAMAVQTDGRLIIGGSFTTVDFSDRRNIARLTAVGGLDTGFDPGSGASDAVYAITLQPDGKSLVGGVFTSFNGTRRIGLTRLFANGAVDTSFLDTAYNHFAGLINSYHFEAPNYVNAIAVEAGGNVLIGGSFTQAGGNFAQELNGNIVPNTDAALAGNVVNVWSRAGRRTRYNVARLVGGSTPGPGNIGFVFDQNTVDEYAGTLSVPFQRYDGRLGTVRGVASTVNNLATGGVDFSGGGGQVSWAENGGIDGTQRSFGSIGEDFLGINILNDLEIEGDELFGLFLGNPTGSINLSGEIVPLGAALVKPTAIGSITDDDFNRGTLAFSSTMYFTNENSVSLRVTVVRTNGSSGSVDVRYFTRDAGSAVAGQDYTGVTLGTLTFGSGVTSQTISIPLVNDTAVEVDEFFTITLTNATGGARIYGATASPTNTVTATAIIIDNDRGLGSANFATTNFVASENAGSAQVTLLRLGGSVGQLSVSVGAVNGTALGGADFSPLTNTVTWVDGDVAPKLVLVPLLDDTTVEGNETVGLRIFNPSGFGGVGVVSNATLTIQEDDFLGTVSFSQTIYDADERGTNVTIFVVRSGGVGGTVTVDYSIANGTAANGVDFTAAGGTLTFAPGVMATNFDITILNNGLQDGERQATLNLSNFNPPAAAGAPAAATLRIIDDESFGDPAGSLDTTFSPLAGGTNAIYALALQPDGKLLVGGEFRTLNRKTRNRVGRLFPDGSLDPVFNPLGGPNAAVRSMALQADGRLVIGGFFTVVQATNRNYIARLLADGTVDAFFNPGGGADNPVYAVAVHQDRRIVVGGSFTTINGISRAGIALLETNGVVSPIFDPGTGADGTVFAVAVQPDGKILIGGDFTTVNGLARSRLARLQSDGSLDVTFDPGTGPSGTVRAIALQADGKIIIGGSFTNVNGTDRGRLARLDSSGAVDSTFLSGIEGGNGDVTAISLQFDGKLIVAGEFTSFNGVTRNRLTRLYRNGKTDPTINFGDGPNDIVNATVIQQDRKIVLGGRFTSYDGESRSFLARIHGGSIAGAGALQFSTPYYEVTENAGQALITVRRRGGTTGDVMVDYQSAAGSAAAGSDYTDVAGTLAFLESETRMTFTVPILNDFVGEPSETISLALANATGGAAIDIVPEATLTIINDDSGVGFSSAAYTVNEGVVGGAVVITVTRTGATNGTSTVTYSTANGSATAPADYSARSGVLTFLPGVTVQSFSVAIVEDDLIEPSETFGITLSNLTGSGALNIASTTVTIVDNDFRAGNLTFSALSYSVAESGGSLTVNVIRTNGSTGVLTVDYATVSGTAQAGNDYVAQSGTLIFAEGQTNQSINIVILDDAAVEGDESFTVQLSSPGPGTVVTGPTNVLVTIVDEEFGPGSLDRTFDPGAGANDFIRSTAVQTDGRIVVGGAFTGYASNGLSYLARVLADGSNDGTFDPGVGPNGLVASVGIAGDGRTVFGGGFTSVDGLPFNHIARVFTNGVVDPNFAPNAGFNGSVNTVALQSDGRVLAGGAFSLPTRGIVRLRLDGTVDTGFAPGSGVNGPVHTVLVQADGSVVVAGAFTLADGLPRSRVARFNSDGSLDGSFAPVAITNGTIYAAVAQANGQIVVGGDFSTSAGTNMVRLARLNTDGSLDASFNPGLGANGVVFALGVNASNQIVVGGSFTAIDGFSRNRFARLHSNGALDTGFDPGPGANATVFTLAVLPSDDIVIGGDFTMVNGAVRNRLAKILGGGVALSPVARASSAGGQLLLTFTVQSGKTYRLETSTNLSDWTPVGTKTAVAGNLQWSEPINVIGGRQFYRLRLMTQ
jgi:uncharacterized delta-60 repeat protein